MGATVCGFGRKISGEEVPTRGAARAGATDPGRGRRPGGPTGRPGGGGGRYRFTLQWLLIKRGALAGVVGAADPEWGGGSRAPWPDPGGGRPWRLLGHGATVEEGGRGTDRQHVGVVEEVAGCGLAPTAGARTGDLAPGRSPAGCWWPRSSRHGLPEAADGGRQRHDTDGRGGLGHRVTPRWVKRSKGRAAARPPATMATTLGRAPKT